MAFNENAVNRDNGGRFDHKLGSPAEVSLPPVVYGGRAAQPSPRWNLSTRTT